MNRRQSGVALLTVLLLVAVMSVLLVSLLDDIRFGVRRAGNAQAQSQAQWYALGAESLARSRLHALGARDRQRTTLDGDWNDRPFLFPIEGGLIRARLSDQSACFNLNSVVQGAEEQLYRRDTGARQFIALARGVGIAPQRAGELADALADWIDSDQAAGPLGAEDSHYLRLRKPYRTSGTLLAEVSELRAIRGFDETSYRLLRPHVCALPSPELSPINVNTLGRDDAILLVMISEGRLGLAAARSAIERRPADGWRDFATFWATPSLAGLSPGNDTLQQLSLRTKYFGLHAEVQYLDADVVLSTLFEVDAAGEVIALARRWTPDP